MPRNGSRCGLLNAKRKPGAALLEARQDLPKRGIARKAKFPLQGSDGNREEGSKVHASSVCSLRIESSQNDGIPAENILPIILGMDIWPQREAFQTRLKAHMDETGKPSLKSRLTSGWPFRLCARCSTSQPGRLAWRRSRRRRGFFVPKNKSDFPPCAVFVPNILLSCRRYRGARQARKGGSH